MRNGEHAIATLTVIASTNFIGQTFSPTISLIDFTNPFLTTATATFSGVQFNGTDISKTPAIDGSNGTNRLLINLDTLIKFDLSGATFTNWSNTDTLTIQDNSLANTIAGTSARDTINGAGGSDVIRGGRGIDTLNGNDGDDSFLYLPVDGSLAGEIVNGGIGADRLRIGEAGTVDFSTASLTSIEGVSFTNSSGIAAAKFVTGQIGVAGSGLVNGITGNAQQNAVDFTGGPFDYGVLTFINWSSGNDTISIHETANGTYGSTGFSDRVTDSVTATFNGQAGDDTYIYSPGTASNTSDDVLNGGDDVDTIMASSASGGLVDLTLLAGLTGFERILFGGTGVGVQMNYEQIQSGFTAIDGGAGSSDLTLVQAAALHDVDLSGLTFVSWNSGDDHVQINGSADINFITGSPVNDVILAGDGDDTVSSSGGADQMDGGFGLDALNYQNSLEGVSVDLAAGTGSGGDAEGDTVTGFENLFGSNSDDTLAGDGGKTESTAKTAMTSSAAGQAAIRWAVATASIRSVIPMTRPE